MKKLITILLLIMIVTGNSYMISRQNVSAKEPKFVNVSEKALDLSAKSAVVMEQGSGEILFE